MFFSYDTCITLLLVHVSLWQRTGIVVTFLDIRIMSPVLVLVSYFDLRWTGYQRNYQHSLELGNETRQVGVLRWADGESDIDVRHSTKVLQQRQAHQTRYA